MWFKIRPPLLHPLCFMNENNTLHVADLCDEWFDAPFNFDDQVHWFTTVYDRVKVGRHSREHGNSLSTASFTTFKRDTLLRIKFAT